jgi:hypothetical protein
MSRIKPIGARLARTTQGLSRNGWNVLGRTFLNLIKIYYTLAKIMCSYYEVYGM